MALRLKKTTVVLVVMMGAACARTSQQLASSAPEPSINGVSCYISQETADRLGVDCEELRDAAANAMDRAMVEGRSLTVEDTKNIVISVGPNSHRLGDIAEIDTSSFDISSFQQMTSFRPFEAVRQWPRGDLLTEESLRTLEQARKELDERERLEAAGVKK